MELEQSLPEIRKRGLGLAAISYDSVAVLKTFADRKGISYPLLSDPESKIIRAFGILNQAVPKGPFYGIPHPGVFLLDLSGVVTAKFFEDDYTQRYTASDILVKHFGAAAGAAHATQGGKHLRVSSSASLAAVHAGQRIALSLDMELMPGIHVYAPGVEGYIPIGWTLNESAAFKAHDFSHPASKTLHLKAINETVPVYTDRIRIVREITIAPDAKVKPLLNGAGELVIEGSLRYQACDDTKCFIPETLALRWTLTYEALDRERAPVKLRRQ